MAASGSQNQYTPVANTNQAPLKTIPPDFRFKTIGQAPSLLWRLTNPDPQVPVSPSPSPPASPKFNSSQESIPDNQSLMKPKASLLERITGPGAAPASQVPAAGPSQSIFATRPTPLNAPADTNEPKATSSKPRLASLKAPSPYDNPNTASTVLPKLDIAPEVPPPDSAMNVDTPANSGPVSGQAPSSLPRLENTADRTATASSFPTARRGDEPSGSQPLSVYATLRNRLEGISEALLNLPTVNTQDADRLLDLARAQSTAALQSANHAQETTKKALESLQEATKAVNDCINAAQESNARTDAAMAALAALRGPDYEKERQRFIAPIQAEITECRRAMDQMEERFQRQRQLRAQRQLQSGAQAAPAVASTAARIAASPTVESTAAPVVASAAASAVAPAVESPAAPTAALPAALSPNGSTLATQPNAAGTKPQAARSRSVNADGGRSLARDGKQKEESKDLTVDDYLRQIAAENKAFQEEHKRKYDAHQAWLDEQVARVQRMQEGTSTAVAQNVQATHTGSSSQTRQAADSQPNDDRMMLDDEDEVKHLREETHSAVSNEVRQRMIKERLEAERHAAQRRSSEEDDKPVGIHTIAEQEKLLQQDEEGRRPQVIQRRQILEQKQLAAVDENINARRPLFKQASPTETVQAPAYLKEESTHKTTEMLRGPTTTKPACQTGTIISGNLPLGAVSGSLESQKKAERAITDADGDRNIHRIDTKNLSLSQSKPNSVSPIARDNPLPDNADYAMKHTQQVTRLERNHLDPSIAANTIPIPVTLPVGLPPRPHFLIHQGPSSLTAHNLELAHASSMSRQQVSILSSTDQQTSQQVTSPQETHVVVVKRDPGEDEDIKPALWNASAPMTPDSLPPDHSTGHGDPSYRVKREESVSIPMLSLPSPPPPPDAPLTTSGEVIPQTFGQQHGSVNDARPEQLQKIQTTHDAPGTQLRNDSHDSDTGGPGQNTRARGPSGSMPSLPPVSMSYRPQDVVPRISLSIPAIQPLSVRPEYPPSTPAFVATEYSPPVPALVVTEYDTTARTNPDPERGQKQSVPESYSSSSLNNVQNGRQSPRLQRRVGGDRYSPSPPPRRSRSRSGRFRSPPRGDHYSPRRNLSPGRGYSGGYSRYSADRSRSRGPMSATNSRNASPNPYSPAIGYREPPLGPANQSRKRSFVGDMPYGPPPRRPRYDEPRDDYMQAGPSRSYVSGQDMRDERSVIANRAPSPPEHRPRPLEQRLQPNVPPDAPHTRGRKPNYEPNNRYNNRRPFPEDNQERYIDDRPPPPNPDRRPPPINQEAPPPAIANEGVQRPDLLSRLGNDNATHDSDYDSYFHQQPASNHHNNHNSNRGGPRRGRGAGPLTPRGGKNSLINRIEG